MTRLNTRLGRWLIIPIPLLLTACCLKNPHIYFSTGTTVGLEATPPTNETPPHVTFGYKRAELALIPVTKLDKQHEPPKNPSQPDKPSPQTVGTPPSGAAPPQPGTGGTSVSNSKMEQPSALSERGCTKAPASTQAQNDGNLNKINDAFSVLASFHLAVNWFGPAKIEQHFATGCAATNLIRGLRDEEEDKRKAEEAENDVLEANRLAKTTKKNAAELLSQAQTLETKTQKTKKDAEKASSTLDDQASGEEAKKNAEEKLMQLGKDAAVHQTTAARLKSAADDINLLKEAKAKAQGAAEKADQATRTEEVRPKTQKTKENVKQVLVNITDMEQNVATDLTNARTTLEHVLTLCDEIKATVPVKVMP